MKKLFLLLGLVLLTATSCKKEGCTDQDATNFESEAKKDDGSCSYSGTLTPWHNEQDALFLVGDGAETLYYYIDDQLVGTAAASAYFPSAPVCGQNGAVTITRDLGSSKSSSHILTVEDQTGFNYGTYSVTFIANTCVTVYCN